MTEYDIAMKNYTKIKGIEMIYYNVAKQQIGQLNSRHI